MDDVKTEVNDNLRKPDYTVTELTLMIRKTIEKEYSEVHVVGEVSGYKVAASGHAYFTLKDEQNLVACVCWNSSLRKANFNLVDGITIVVKGTVTIYGGQSKYQISVSEIRQMGAGRLMQIFQELKLRLAQEGLFDQSHKRPIPSWPSLIAVVTSAQGAVFWDIVHRIKDRFPTRVILYSVVVQGPGAANEIVKAISALNDVNYMQDLIPDVIIVARGGGSIEDLWSFNEEKVVRAVFNSKIPIVSAIGHETDFTLTDFAADLRAPTPTAAAEFVVPVMADFKSRLESLVFRYSNAALKYLDQNARLLKAYALSDQNLIGLLRNKEQRFDDIDTKMRTYSLRVYIEYLNRWQLRPEIIQGCINFQRLLFEKLVSSFERIALRYLENCQNNMRLCSIRMQKLDIGANLKRGFVLVKSKGATISSAKNLVLDEMLTLEFHDGLGKVQVKDCSLF